MIDEKKLIVEIEKRKCAALQKKESCKRHGLEKIMHQIGVYNELLSFIDSMQEEPVSKDLDEAAKDYINNVHVGDHHIRTNAFKAGALWQREKMLKDAVEAHAIPCDNEFLCDFSKIPYFDNWEKVKLIIVKEE